MHNTLGNALTIEMGELFKQIVVIKGQGAARPYADAVVIVRHRGAAAGSDCAHNFLLELMKAAGFSAFKSLYDYSACYLE